MQQEFELKLLFRPEDVDRLRGLPLIKKLASGRASTRQLVSVYYDTPGRKLRKQFVSLRVRRESGGYIQCVKSVTSRIGGMLVRNEDESPVPSNTPVVAEIKDKDLKRLVKGAGADKLEPVFRTSFKRFTRRLTLADGAKLNLDIDTGEIITATAREPLCELEMELTGGKPLLLFDLALDIHAEVPLHLSTISKAQRGFRLMAGEKPEWRKDARVDLSGDATLEDALVHTVQHCLNHLLANELCTLESDHPEGVHQMRVALRRLRSALTLFRSVLPPEQSRLLIDEVKWLTSQMAATRDWDVFREEILGPVTIQSPDDNAFQVLQDQLRLSRSQSRSATRKAIRSERYTRFLLIMSGWLAKRAWREHHDKAVTALLSGPVTGLSDSLIAKRHKKVIKQGRHFWKLSIAERHQLRIDVKKLRYASDFFSSLYPGKRVRPYATKLSKLQDALGYLNDVAVAENLVQRLCGKCKGDDALQCRLAGGIVIGWHTHVLAQSEGILVKGVSDFVKCKPFWSKT